MMDRKKNKKKIIKPFGPPVELRTRFGTHRLNSSFFYCRWRDQQKTQHQEQAHLQLLQPPQNQTSSCRMNFRRHSGLHCYCCYYCYFHHSAMVLFDSLMLMSATEDFVTDPMLRSKRMAPDCSGKRVAVFVAPRWTGARQHSTPPK